MIPQSLKTILTELAWELTSVGARQDEYVLFGSTPLILRGVIDREPGDVDIFVTRRVWGALLARGPWEVETPKAGGSTVGGAAMLASAFGALVGAIEFEG